jgi:hypothetical protein
MFRHLSRTAIAIIVALLAGLVCFFVFPFWRPMVWRSQSVKALSAANDETALREAVGSLGVFIPVKDGSWIAIRYTDSHSGYIFSMAIARDSGGQWFESKYHFCGEFRFFDQWVRAQSQPADSAERLNAAAYVFDDEHGDLRDIFNAPNLPKARAALLRAGFRPID